MNPSQNLFNAPTYPSNPTPASGMVLRSGNTTNNQYTSANTTTSFFNTSLSSKNLFTTPNQLPQTSNHVIFGQSKPSTDIFSGLFDFFGGFIIEFLIFSPFLKEQTTSEPIIITPCKATTLVSVQWRRNSTSWTTVTPETGSRTRIFFLAQF